MHFVLQSEQITLHVLISDVCSSCLMTSSGTTKIKHIFKQPLQTLFSTPTTQTSQTQLLRVYKRNGSTGKSRLLSIKCPNTFNLKFNLPVKEKLHKLFVVIKNHTSHQIPPSSKNTAKVYPCFTPLSVSV